MAEITPASPHEARAFLRQALAYDTTDGASSQEDHERDCSFCLVLDDAGQPCGAFSLRTVGKTVWIMQAGGQLAGSDLVKSVLPCIEREARKNALGQIAITTRRKGLVRKMQRAGYQITGITLRKRI